MQVCTTRCCRSPERVEEAGQGPGDRFQEPKQLFEQRRPHGCCMRIRRSGTKLCLPRCKVSVCLTGDWRATAATRSPRKHHEIGMYISMVAIMTHTQATRS
jgi:hypothetical protein